MNLGGWWVIGESHRGSIPYGHSGLDAAPAVAMAHLTTLELDIDQEGPVGDPQGARPPAPCRGLQLQREAVL